MDTDNRSEYINGSTNSLAVTSNAEERELVSRLKAIIDRSGKYSYRLDDMVAGFSAGRGITPMQARMEIEKQFVQTYQCSPKQYMDQRYQEMQQYR